MSVLTPKGRWIIAIVGLLAANMTAMIILAVVANVGHSEVIPDYYARASHYDDAMAQARTNVALGWAISSTIVGGELEVVIVDRAGAPIAHAAVRTETYPRARAAQRRTTTLVDMGGGHYRAAIDADPGIHDVAITVDARAAHYATEAVVVAR